MIRALILWLLCLLAAVVSLAWQFVAIFGSPRRALRIAIGFDQTANAAFGGDEDETISSRCWRYRDEHPYMALRKLVDTAFALAGESDHCENAFRSELSKRRST